MKNQPQWLPQSRQFSQADPHIVQAPEGLDAGDEPVKVTDVEGRNVKRYVELQARPAGWYEASRQTTLSITIGGKILLIDDQLGFVANSVMIDNWTNQWVQVEGVRRSIPPYTGGWTFNIPTGQQIARVALQSPAAALAQPAAIAGETVWVGFSEAMLPPAQGFGRVP